MKDEKSKTGLYFLLFAIVCYLVAALYDVAIFKASLLSAWNILIQIYYVFILILILMTLADYFIKPKALKKYLGKKSGISGWIIAIGGGIISTGPIYMWYPLLSDLKDDGMKDGLIATFLYNRAIKIPLIPIAIVYFSLEYIIILTFVMIAVSLVQGYLIELLSERRII